METGNEEKYSLYVNTKKYMDDVFKPLLPNVGISTAHSTGAFDLPLSTAEIELDHRNLSLYQSPYYYGNKLEFIHFTSLQNALNIAREGQFRLYELNNMSDPLEMEFSLNMVSGKAKISAERISSWKQSAFCLSMCENKDDGKIENFNNWQKFGHDGHGVGIVLSFNKTNQKNWYSHFLSKVYYGERYSSRFLKLQERHQKYHAEGTFRIRNQLEDLIINLCCFHKIEIYKHEKEVRLLKIIENDYFKPKVSSEVQFDLTKNNKPTHFTTLRLQPNNAGKIYKIAPEIKIKEFILGYRISSKEMSDIKGIISEISNTVLGYNIPTRLTNLKRYFPE